MAGGAGRGGTMGEEREERESVDSWEEARLESREEVGCGTTRAQTQYQTHPSGTAVQYQTRPS
eukprot:278498-Rhodomonas_salina.1